MNKQINLEYNIADDKFYLNLKFGQDTNKTIQVYSQMDEFNFFFTGTLTLSTKYKIWISLSDEGKKQFKNGETMFFRIISDKKIEEEIEISNDKRVKVLFITPHLSTGGCPQYLLKKLETFKDMNPFVVEFSFLGDAYVIQRNKIKELVKDNFYSLQDNKDELLDIIDKIHPDIIHFEEIPETFISPLILEKIYTNDRKFNITETTHGSETSPADKIFLPDRFIFCSKYSQHIFKSLNVESTIWEYPIEDYIRPDRTSTLKALNLDPAKIHILNIGLFTAGKNQGELIELARNYIHENVEFHFIGNQASNFESYWSPLMESLPKNCKIWGERNDVDKFLGSCDLFYFASILELNPLVIKEALSWKIPVIMRNLRTYGDSYMNNPLVTFIDDDTKQNILKNAITKIQNEKTYRTKIVHLVSELNSEIELKSIESVSKLGFFDDIEYTIHFNTPTLKLPNIPSLYKNNNLKPGHYGCFEAFRKAIVEDYTDDFDFLIICERDCFLEKDTAHIHALLQRTYYNMNKFGINYFSFGDIDDLDCGVKQSDRLIDIEDFAFFTNKIIGLQFIIFNRAGIEFLKQQFKTNNWYGMDIWFNHVFNENKSPMGILNERVATQLNGYSLIDQKEKRFLKNEKK